MQPSNYVGTSENNKINYIQSDLIIHKQPHKGPPFHATAVSAHLLIVMRNLLFF